MIITIILSGLVAATIVALLVKVASHLVPKDIALTGADFDDMYDMVPPPTDHDGRGDK